MWLVLLPSAHPPVPASASANAWDQHIDYQVDTQPFLNVQDMLAAGDNSMILVMSNRTKVFSPCYARLDWNTTVVVPAGSLCDREALPVNRILHAVYCIDP